MYKYFTTLLTLLLTSPLSFADHSWGNYHWARTASSFDLIVVNSTTNDWDSHVSIAISDWSQSTNLNMIEDTNGATSKKVRRRCRATNGQLRICNLNYGDTGWLGIAGISLDTQGHIVNGYTKLNDSYFSLPFYNNANWKKSVTCQELGHNVGLGHQDEDFNNTALGTCMDYQDPPTDFPDTHDYQQLASIYAHTDTYDSFDTGSDNGDTSDGTCNAPPGKGCNKAGANNDVGWGISIGRRGNAETFIRVGKDGTRYLTHVTWAIGH
jgi:hypothetical protein